MCARGSFWVRVAHTGACEHAPTFAGCGSLKPVRASTHPTFACRFWLASRANARSSSAIEWSANNSLRITWQFSPLAWLRGSWQASSGLASRLLDKRARSNYQRSANDRRWPWLSADNVGRWPTDSSLCIVKYRVRSSIRFMLSPVFPPP